MSLVEPWLIQTELSHQHNLQTANRHAPYLSSCALLSHNRGNVFSPLKSQFLHRNWVPSPFASSRPCSISYLFPLLYLHCFNVNILDFGLRSSFTKCYHGNNWVKDTFISCNLMFIIISNIFVMNKDYIIIWENNQKDNDIYYEYLLFKR